MADTAVRCRWQEAVHVLREASPELAPLLRLVEAAGAVVGSEGPALRLNLGVALDGLVEAVLADHTP